MTFTQARRQLEGFVTQKRTRSQLASEIGCGLDFLVHVFAGRKTFGPRYIFTIEEKFGIPARAWSTRRNAKAA